MHPYTQGLIGAVPVPGVIQDELAVIPGSVPNLIALPEGCRFAPRCAPRVAHNNVLATELHPQLRDVTGGHQVRCWLFHHADGSPRADADTWPEAALPDVPDVAPELDAPEGPLDEPVAPAGVDA
jgi:oligopeptide/dipeptide ABC transporter ATP-binding protein